jgi:hypothetical protein
MKTVEVSGLYVAMMALCLSVMFASCMVADAVRSRSTTPVECRCR